MKKLGYHKLISVSPRLFVGNVDKNVTEHLSIINDVKSKNPSVILFPELSLTGYTCEDLFHNESLLQATQTGLLKLAQETKHISSLIIVGLPFQHKGKLYNGAACVYKGEVLSLHSKTFVPNYKEFYENRWFSEGSVKDQVVVWGSRKIPFSNDQIIRVGDLLVGVEICEDVWAPISPSVGLALGGANLIVNLSASNELVAKDEYRRNLLKITSAKLNCGYLYTSSGPWESSKDLVFGGYMGYFEDGSLIKENSEILFTSKYMETEIDVQKINFERRKNTTFGKAESSSYKILDAALSHEETNSITRKVVQNPFVPQGDKELSKRTQEILEIQSTGLARRVLALGQKTPMVLGLSGGLDSTLALLVCVKACQKLGVDTTQIHTISMPGFGTSDRTKNQALDLSKAFSTTFKEIDITKATTQHLQDIEHEGIDFVYENAQARERMQILFDYSNKVNGFVVNTSCLSEAVLGWSTFGADQLGNYGVNISIPKSLVRFMIKNYPSTEEQAKILHRVYETPVSPELLPLNAKTKEIAQKTEDILGPYELIDFYIFHHLRNGFTNEKILFLAEIAYAGKYESEYMDKIFKNTYTRFRRNQFKRTTLPSGVKVGISISPRGDLRLPDEYEGEGN